MYTMPYLFWGWKGGGSFTDTDGNAMFTGVKLSTLARQSCGNSNLDAELDNLVADLQKILDRAR